MITVWRIALDPHRAPPADAIAELSDGERARAARFVSDELRNRWLHGHVALRWILAREVGEAPGALQFGANEAGKPALASPATEGLEFNFSDSGDVALLAVSDVGAVGVDVEQVRPQAHLERIARRFFAAEERAALFALPESERLDAFFRIWARKEAYIKALGVGLAAGLELFAVSLGAEDARLVRVQGAADELTAWTLRTVGVPRGYQGALAVRRPSVELVARDYAAD